MEEKDFSKIHLEDIGIYSAAVCSFHNLFKTKKIKNLVQILDEDLMMNIAMHCRKTTKMELTAFVSLMKYQYLDIPLAIDVKLNESCEGFGGHWPCCFGFSDREITEIEYFISQNKYYLENKTIIDLFEKYISSKEDVGWHSGRTKKIMKMHIESYKKNELLSNTNENEFNEKENLTDVDVLSILKSQLTKLISTRDILDNQIESLQEKIELLSNRQPEDGIKK